MSKKYLFLCALQDEGGLSNAKGPSALQLSQIKKLKRLACKVHLWDAVTETKLAPGSTTEEADWVRQWATKVGMSGPNDWAIPIARAQLVVRAAKRIFELQYKVQEAKLFKAYVAGFRRRLEVERRRTMQSEVYARGEARVACDKIEIGRARPRVPDSTGGK